MSNFYEFNEGCRIDPYVNWIMQITHQGFIPASSLDEEKINRYSSFVAVLEELRGYRVITLRQERTIVNKLFDIAIFSIKLVKDEEQAGRIHAQYNKWYKSNRCFLGA